MMTIADLKDRVTVLKETVTRDREMNQVKTYEPYRTVWANVKLKRSNWSVTQEGHSGVKQYTVTIRYDRDILALLCLLEYKGQVLMPLSVPYNDSNAFIVIEAQERSAVPTGRAGLL